MNTAMLFFLRFSLVCFALTCIKPAHAQLIKGDEQINSRWASASQQIDGQLNDWADSLNFHNEETGFSFSMRNNIKTLFIAVKSEDSQNLNRIFSRGISFSFNTDGKKKAGPTIIFPVIERSGQTSKAATTPTAEQVKELQKSMLSNIQRINVFGFSDIRDGSVSLQNTYGLSAAASLDVHNKLVIEIAVPLELLDITTDHQAIACLFEINGVKAPKAAYDPNRDSRNTRYGYPSRGYGYDRLPRYNKTNEPKGFWIKTVLAKNLNN